jgi:hypothetical protein
MPEKQYPTEFAIRYTPLPKERVAQWQAGMRAIYDLLMNASEGMILAAEAEQAIDISVAREAEVA